MAATAEQLPDNTSIEAEIERLKALKDEIKARIQPQKDAIKDDERTVTRLENAIDALSGGTPPAAPAASRRSRTRTAGPTTGTLSEADKRKVTDFLGAFPGNTAAGITDGTGVKVTAAIMRDTFGDQIVTEGQKRGMRYSLK